MYKEVNIKHWIDEQYCEHVQCQHNNDEFCTKYDEESAKEIVNNMGENTVFKCFNFTVKESYCAECGAKLEECVDYYPYGNTIVPYYYLSCPNC
ncbi:MAG: hypothetical protein GX879_04800 [Bacteroidales bacterium]|nr:hypothetical protein [Bacteroidales bacterium]